MSPQGTRSRLVAPGYGPTLPALLRQRFGLSGRTTVVVIVLALALLAGLAAFAATRDDGEAELVGRSGGGFSLLYQPDVLHRAKAAPGELARLETSGGPIAGTVTVRPARLPASNGNAIFGAAPVIFERRLMGLERRYPDFVLRGDGRARLNGAPGYEISYRTGPAGRRVYWQQMVVVPEDPDRDGAELTLRFETHGKLSDAEHERVKVIKSAYRSFRFGTERP